ncbi:hypothetical protein JAAARDRAFT_130764 [Jaapia argillacea MUCL 33604]|uniref:PPM-type phosphatase domain-containing protein n=1 Tax=Jaapia argillacea MUCL 33604 TaxID=933084 RepID=A0A067PS56_9AGAM|nr:hypothetical protein JAAARDRAFT_130764 [Jaapia argillacea MUCL 33604]
MGWGPPYGPWRYRVLAEPQVTLELARLSNAQSSQGRVDTLTFQPCPNPEEQSQDRYIVQDWDLRGGTWRFAGVFDGHAGQEAVDYTVANLPNLIKQSLETAVTSSHEIGSSTISQLLADSIQQLDDSLTHGLLDLFPGGPDAISRLTDADIQSIVNDGGENSRKVVRCMRGTTALVSLIDPRQENLWVASLGDCQAVLGVKNSNQDWDVSILSSNHNGREPSEVERIHKAHPGEPECVLRDRVLGAIAVTRAIGDHLFKLPSIYTERVFMNAKPGFRISTAIQEFLPRNISPPYLTANADVQHVNLVSIEGTERFLIMCSDGLVDLYDAPNLDVELAERWIRIVSDANGENRALSLLRDSLGGTDEKKVSRMMTVEMDSRWMDDVTLVVQRV